MSKVKKPWTVQWHIAADGTVIRQRSKGDGEHQQLYGSYTISRPLEISDLDALDERLARDRKVLGTLVYLLAGFAIASLAGIVAAVILAVLGLEVAGWLGVAAVIGFVVAMLCSGAFHGLMISRWNRAWREAGFESANPVTMSAREARDIVEAPGAVSGGKTRVVRA